MSKDRKEYFKKYNKEYYLKHRKEILKQQKEYRTKNEEKISERKKKYYKNNQSSNKVLIELEEWLNTYKSVGYEDIGTFQVVLDKIQELKEKYYGQ